MAQYATILTAATSPRAPHNLVHIAGGGDHGAGSDYIDDVLPLETEYAGPSSRIHRNSVSALPWLVPLLREGVAIGTIPSAPAPASAVLRQHVALLETFADQAVIAIENVRLFQELKESLEQQTATSEILGVIASSPTDIQPVLDAVAENAARLCDASDAVIRLVEGKLLRLAAHHGPIPFFGLSE